MALQTFTPPYPPSKSTDKPEVRVLTAQFGDGYTQSAGDGMNNVRRILSLSWDNLTPEQATSIVTFLRNHKGYEPFVYTPSDETVPLRWTCTEWSREKGTPNAVEATFRQSFNLV